MLCSASSLARPRHTLRWYELLALLIIALLAGRAFAQEANVFQMYYVPMPEDVITGDNKLLSVRTSDSFRTVVSIAVALDNTLIYYDHDADGYEMDVTIPEQPTTRIWGDGNDANGIAPGFTSDPDGLPGGTVLLLDEIYDTTTAETCAVATDPCRTNGGDRFGANRALAVIRGGYNTFPGLSLAGSVEVADSNNWGDFYTMPIGGTDITPSVGAVTRRELFELASVYVQARDITTVVLTRALDSSTESAVLAAGETVRFENVRPGDTVDAGGKQVQVNLLTGNIEVPYESRWYRLAPDSQWTSDYLSAVGTTAPDNAVYYYLFNPSASDITISAAGEAGLLANVLVPAQSTVEYRGVTAATGVRFFHFSATPQPFYVLSAVDAGPDNFTAVYDWGFSVSPVAALTGQAIVAFAPASFDNDNDFNSDDPDSSPVWVTAVQDTHLCIDYDGNGSVDEDFDISSLEMVRLLDASDNTMSGAFIYTINDINGDNTVECIGEGGDDTQTNIAVAWGQDISTSEKGVPALDLGVSIPAVPKYGVSKHMQLRVDADNSGSISPGDTVVFVIDVNNYGALTLNNAELTDVLQPLLRFDPSNSTLEGALQWECVEQLDGTTLCQFGKFSVPPRSTKIVEIAATIPLDAMGVQVIDNTVSLAPGDDPPEEAGSIGKLNTGSIGDTVWLDANDDGVIGGTEDLAVGVVVELRNAMCTPGSDCRTVSTDAAGKYLFSGLPEGEYDVAVIAGLPSGYDHGYDADAGADGLAAFTLALGVDERDADFGLVLTATAPEPELELALRQSCVLNAPYIDYTITPIGLTSTNRATIELLGSDDVVVSTLVDQPLTGTLLWPEAAVDRGGNGTAWPGRAFISGEWVEIPTTVRPALTLRVALNSGTEGAVRYPPNCDVNAELQTPQTPRAPRALPPRPTLTSTPEEIPTGGPLFLALMGALLMLAARRSLSLKKH